MTTDQNNKLDAIYNALGNIGRISINGVIYGTNNSSGGYISATGYASFILPKNTKVEFTAMSGLWELKANNSNITSGYITSSDNTSVVMTGTISSGSHPTPKASYILTFNYS